MEGLSNSTLPSRLFTSRLPMFSTPMPLIHSRTWGRGRGGAGAAGQARRRWERHTRSVAQLQLPPPSLQPLPCQAEDAPQHQPPAALPHLVVVDAGAQRAEEVDGLAGEGVHQRLHVAAVHVVMLRRGGGGGGGRVGGGWVEERHGRGACRPLRPGLE